MLPSSSLITLIVRNIILVSRVRVAHRNATRHITPGNTGLISANTTIRHIITGHFTFITCFTTPALSYFITIAYHLNIVSHYDIRILTLYFITQPFSLHAIISHYVRHYVIFITFILLLSFLRRRLLLRHLRRYMPLLFYLSFSTSLRYHHYAYHWCRAYTVVTEPEPGEFVAHCLLPRPSLALLFTFGYCHCATITGITPPVVCRHILHLHYGCFTPLRAG